MYADVVHPLLIAGTANHLMQVSLYDGNQYTTTTTTTMDTPYQAGSIFLGENSRPCGYGLASGAAEVCINYVRQFIIL